MPAATASEEADPEGKEGVGGGCAEGATARCGTGCEADVKLDAGRIVGAAPALDTFTAGTLVVDILSCLTNMSAGGTFCQLAVS